MVSSQPKASGCISPGWKGTACGGPVNGACGNLPVHDCGNLGVLLQHGTTTLFAALDVASGEILAQCKPRHRHQEVLSFLRHIDANVPATLDVHLIVDNYATHKHATVKAWLARRPRYHVHYTPTYSSWLNQVERWFGLITQRAIRRGSFRTVRELVRRIEHFVAHYNATSRPFKWTATADSILEKLHRLLSRITEEAVN